MIVNSGDKSIDSKPLIHQELIICWGMEVPAGKYELHLV